MLSLNGASTRFSKAKTFMSRDSSALEVNQKHLHTFKTSPLSS